MNQNIKEKRNLLGADKEALVAWMTERGEPAFKARQVLSWIHHHGISDFSEMHNISSKVKEQLIAEATIDTPQIVGDTLAKDGTRKFLFNVGNKNTIETIWIPDTTRNTICISSQAGCALACTFCLTGKSGFAANLTSEQIMGQFHAVARNTKQGGKISNVVFMGMGEPLLNLENVAPVLRLLIDDHACKLSRRKVTISTAGVVPGIDLLRKEAPVALAVSLHAPNDELRSELVPLNRRYPIEDLIDACQRYLEDAPRDFITFEYVLLNQVNDHTSLARDLAKLLQKIHGKVNLIPFNPFPGSQYTAPSRNRIMVFRDELNKYGVITTIRRQRGSDILAACGQLAGEVSGRTPSSCRMATVPITPL